MALVARLPVELYRHIVEDVPSTQDLCRLLVTSRTLNDEAERVLYQTLYIDTRPSSKPHSSILATSLIVHLITCPRVARHVKTLTIRAWLPEAAELISTLFRSLPHLTKLTFYPHYSRVFYTGYATMEAGYLLQGCTSQLRHLTYRGALDAGFINFLHAQPSIIDFVWEEYNDGPTIPSTVLPNLSTLRGSGDLLQRLLPGRPITRFKWEEVTFFKSLTLLSCLRRGLECLSISPGGWPLQMQLPSLYFLELTLSPMQRNALLSWLPNLPSLRIIAINCPADLSSDVFYPLVGEMFNINTSLSRVEIYSPTTSDMLVIWRRGAVQPEVVRNIFMSEIRKELWKMV